MIDAIVYSSLSGSCEEYAHRMSAALHVPFFTEQSHICPTGRKVVYIGWLLAGKVVGLNKAKERYNVVGVVSVGMGAPAANAEEVCRKKNGLGTDIAVFPLQGRFDLKRLPLPYRLIMKVKIKDIAKRLNAKAAKTTLTPVFGLLSGNRDLEESITTAIISEEEIADGASPELLSIRRELRRVSGKVRETLNRMISGERSKYLQENIITQRNGRFVVPVKVEHRGDVPGLVHDTSSTGATVFVEPQQVVEINNQIKVLEGREENEIERILAELSSRVSMYKGAIEQVYEAYDAMQKEGN